MKCISSNYCTNHVKKKDCKRRIKKLKKNSLDSAFNSDF